MFAAAEDDVCNTVFAAEDDVCNTVGLDYIYKHVHKNFTFT